MPPVITIDPATGTITGIEEARRYVLSNEAQRAATRAFFAKARELADSPPQPAKPQKKPAA